VVSGQRFFCGANSYPPTWWDDQADAASLAVEAVVEEPAAKKAQTA